MQLFSVLQLYLFAVGKIGDSNESNTKDVTPLKRFYVDGNNLLGHKGTPKNRHDVAEKLKSVKGAEIVVVFDGVKEGPKETIIDTFGDLALLRQVALGEGISADSYIQEEIQDLLRSKMTRARIEVVTADRLLRRQVLDMKPIVRGVINPVVFWKRYRPRLTGLKSNFVNNNLPKEQDETSTSEKSDE
jgi:YacP-like NYN domain